MTRVGFITSPLTSGHSGRGVGFYVKRLLPHLKSQAPNFGFEIFEIENLLKIKKLKLKIVHYPFFDLFTPSLPLISPAKTIITIHDVIPLEFPDYYPPGIKGKLALTWQKLALSRAERVITDSYASIKAIRKHLSVPHDKIKLVYLAPGLEFKPLADPKILASVLRKYRLPAKFILYVGDINWNKNLPTLAEACQKIQIPLVLVGKQVANLEQLDTSHPELSHLSNLKSQISNLTVRRLGFVPESDLVAIYNLATIYCQPSYAEGFGLPVLEAMACGAPVICSRSHSLPEIAGDAAIFFDPYSAADLINKINSVLSDKNLQQKLSAGGIEQAAKFTWTKTARETLQVYQEVM